MSTWLSRFTVASLFLALAGVFVVFAMERAERIQLRRQLDVLSAAIKKGQPPPAPLEADLLACRTRLTEVIGHSDYCSLRLAQCGDELGKVASK